MLTLIFCSRRCLCAFTAFFCRYVKSMQWTQIASIAKVLLALTRLLLQAPSENLWILASGTERRLLRQSSQIFVHATILLLLSHTRRPGLIRRRSRLARCIFHCVSAPISSHFAMFVTCVCITSLCVAHADYTCLASRCGTARMRRREFGVSMNCCGGSPPTPWFSHYLNHGHLQ